MSSRVVDEKRGNQFSLYNDIRRLLALGFPGKTEGLGRDYFLAALSDPKLRIRVLDQSPKNLDETMVIVQRMETYSALGPGQASGGSVSDERDTVQEVRADGDNKNDGRWKQQLENELASHRRQIEQLKADNDFWRARATAKPPPLMSLPTAGPTAVSGGRWPTPPPTQAAPRMPLNAPPSVAPNVADGPWATTPQPAVSGPSYYAPPPAWSAEAAGNWFPPVTPQTDNNWNYQNASPSYGAPPFQQQQTFTRGQGRGRGRGLRHGPNYVDPNQCRRCLQRGHWSKDCTFPPAIANVNGVAVNSIAESYTYFTAILNGKKIAILVDTGASCNLLPHRLVKGQDIEKCTAELFAANGSPIKVIGAKTIGFYAAGKILSARFFITDAVDTPILGFTWLRDNNCCWRIGDNKFTVRGITIPLLCRPTDCMYIRRAYVRDAACIPPDHIVRIPVDLPANSLHTPSGNWLIGPKELRPGLLMSCSLISDMDEYPAIQLFNLSGKKHFVSAGLCLGPAAVIQPADTVEPFTGGLGSQPVVHTRERDYPPADLSTVNYDVPRTPPAARAAGGGYSAAAAPHSSDVQIVSHASTVNIDVDAASAQTRHGFTDDAASSDGGKFDHIQCMFDSIPADLTDSEREQVIGLLKRNADLFARTRYDIGRTSLMEATIDTGDHAPLSEPLRRHPKANLDLIDQAVEDLKAADLIEDSISPWSSNLVVIRRPDGPPRVTVDLRRLNGITSKQSFCMPHVAESLEFLSESKYISVLDCTQSYFHIPLRESDREKTAFLTRRGLFQWKCLPQGATNAPAIFSRLMSLVLRGVHFLCCLAFIDDVAIIGRTFSKHLLCLELVFNRLRYAGLKLKPAKCKLFQNEVSFLGFKVSGNSIRADENKTACVKSWAFPQNISELRSLVGFFSYYRSFIPGFAKRVEPLVEMLRKDQPITPTARRQAAFDDLKTALVNAPILGIYRAEGELIVDVDSSSTSCGAICSQEQDGLPRVLEYASRCLSKSERNLCAYRRELLGLIFALRKFRPYLLGRQFRVRVDNLALKSILTVRNASGVIARHLDFLADFNFTLEHRAGSKHQNCDALSRLRPCAEGPDGGPCKQCQKLVTGRHVQAVQTRRQARLRPLWAPISPDIWPDANNCTDARDDDICENNDDDISFTASDVDDVASNAAQLPDSERAAPKPPGLLGRTATNAAENLGSWDYPKLREQQLLDPDIADVIKALEANTRPSPGALKCLSPALRALFLQYDSLIILNGVLFRIFYNDVGSAQYYQLVVPRSFKCDFLELIHNDFCGHMGSRKCLPEIQKRAWWFRWRNDVKLYIRCCAKCSSYHRGKAPKQGYLQPMIVSEPAARWSIDLSGDYPPSNGYRYIFTAVCTFSKFAVAVPIRNKSAKTVARVIVERVLLLHSLPCEILTDLGGEFVNELSDELYRLLGIKHLRTTARKPSTNGGVERLHRTLNSIMAKMVSESQSDWANLLPYVIHSYNMTPHAATGWAPFYILYGREPRWNIDMLLHNFDYKENSVPSYTADLLRRMQLAHDLVRETLHRQAVTMSDWYNRRVRPASFSLGDTVRVFNDSVKPGLCPKWSNSYSDVATVVKQLNDVTYLLHSPAWRADRITHVDKMKKVENFSP